MPDPTCRICGYQDHRSGRIVDGVCCNCTYEVEQKIGRGFSEEQLRIIAAKLVEEEQEE